MGACGRPGVTPLRCMSALALHHACPRWSAAHAPEEWNTPSPLFSVCRLRHSPRAHRCACGLGGDRKRAGSIFVLASRCLSPLYSLSRLSPLAMTSTYASTFSSFLGSSSLLTALPDSPCSPVPEAEEQEEELPAADDPYWPRFRAVWGVVEEDGALAACSGRGSGVAAEAEALALKKWRAHQRWRSANQLDAVFERPHPLFHFLKRVSLSGFGLSNTNPHYTSPPPPLARAARPNNLALSRTRLRSTGTASTSALATARSSCWSGATSLRAWCTPAAPRARAWRTWRCTRRQ